MAEVWRKEDEPLTTADIAGTKTASVEETESRNPVRDGFDSEADGGPRLVRSEQRDASLEEMVAGSTLPAESVSSSVSTRPAIGDRSLSRDQPQLNAGGGAPLLSDVELTDLRTRWSGIQAGFVDEKKETKK